MPSVTGFTATRTQEIEDASIVSASIVAGHLILERHDGAELDAGSVQGPQPIPHSSVAAVSNASIVGTTSATFNNLDTPLSVSGFQKYRADTKLICEYAGTIYNDAGSGQFEVAINLSGVNYLIVSGYSTWNGKAGFIQITGIAAGTYTIQVYYRRSNGVGTVLDGARNSLKVTETF